jgi:hypothetical protein
MTVVELIEQLQQFRPDAQVFLSIDSEGNEFKPLVEADLYPDFIEVNPNRTWIAEVFANEDDTPCDESEQSVVIWPLN